MGNDSLIKIDPALVDNLVREHIQIAVAESLSKNGPVLVDKFIAAIINAKVDEKGVVQSYERYNVQSWLDWAVGTSLRETVHAVIKNEIEKMKPEIEQAVRKHLGKSNNAIAQAVVKGVADSLKYDWNFKLTLGTDK